LPHFITYKIGAIDILYNQVMVQTQYIACHPIYSTVTIYTALDTMYCLNFDIKAYLMP